MTSHRTSFLLPFHFLVFKNSKHILYPHLLGRHSRSGHQRRLDPRQRSVPPEASFITSDQGGKYCGVSDADSYASVWLSSFDACFSSMVLQPELFIIRERNTAPSLDHPSWKPRTNTCKTVTLYAKKRPTECLAVECTGSCNAGHPDELLHGCHWVLTPDRSLDCSAITVILI
jgi:hypothetical protein